MKKVKVIALILAAVLMALTFASCGGSSVDEPASQDAAPVSDAADAATDALEIASDYETIKAKGTLVVGITDFAPMDYKENGEWVGFDADLGRIVAEKLGLGIEFVEISWDNKFIELKTGNIDCIWNGMTITDEVKLNSNVTKAYAMNKQVVVMAADKVADYADVESLKELTFAVETGSAGQTAADDNELNSTVVASQADALLEVKAGTADACIIDSTMAAAMTGDGTDYSDLASGISLTDEEYGISFRQDSDMTEKVNALLDELTADGTMAELSEKYGVQLAA